MTGGNVGFKENLLLKMEIDRLARKVTNSLGSGASGSKVDKDSMRRLLELAGYTHQRRRQMDLYHKDTQNEKGIILVLDNDLTIYETNQDDVVMRKNPFIKEMVSIRNIIKILNDKDVVISRKADSVQRIQKACLETIDLSYSDSDIADITHQGLVSLSSAYAEGIKESLAMFAELLGYRPPPNKFKLRHCEVSGALHLPASGETVFGPAVLFSLIDNQVKLIDRAINANDIDDMGFYQKVGSGDEKAPVEGDAVFHYLEKAVLNL
jgi:hypothetical protein